MRTLNGYSKIPWLKRKATLMDVYVIGQCIYKWSSFVLYILIFNLQVVSYVSIF